MVYFLLLFSFASRAITDVEHPFYMFIGGLPLFCESCVFY